MTATSGPGFSLMMENLGLALMTETPCVLVNVQRGGPSTGLPTLVGQQDMMQARWGSHGDYELIALSPDSPQEMFDLTVEAFNLSERVRVPALVMADEVVGHMTEKVVIPPADRIRLFNRRKPAKGEKYLPFKAGEDLVPPMGAMGDGHFQHITGLTHDERGYPAANAAVQDKLVRRLVDKIRKYARTELTKYEAVMMEDAEVVVLCYGITGRSALRAVRVARERGIKAGLVRLQIVWPSPTTWSRIWPPSRARSSSPRSTWARSSAKSPAPPPAAVRSSACLCPAAPCTSPTRSLRPSRRQRRFTRRHRPLGPLRSFESLMSL
jgi:2-oxoglutarate ferredoxin oxidoreductase subunit alpha